MVIVIVIVITITITFTITITITITILGSILEHRTWEVLGIHPFAHSPGI